MSIIRRSKRNTTFVQIDKTALQDKSISWKAKGLLAYLLSLPDDWQIYTSELTTHSTDGRDSTNSGLNELIKAGYVQRKQNKVDGKFAGYIYTVYETSILDAEKPERENRCGKSVNGKPATTNNNNTNKDKKRERTQKTPESVEQTTHTLIEQATSQIKPLKQLLQDVIHDIGEDNGLTAMAEAIKFDYGLDSRQVMQLIYEVLLERQQKGEVLKLIVPSTENEQIVFYMQLFARVRRFADYAQSKKQAVKMYGRNTQSKHEPEKM